MLKKLMMGGLALLMAPMMQSCNDRDVASGAVIGAVVGGSIAAIASDNNGYRGRDRYYRSRYNNYYGPRRNYYRSRYYNRYEGRSYARVSRGYMTRRGSYRGYRRGGFGRYEAVAPLSLVMRSSDAKAIGGFFQLPAEVAAIMTDVKNRAAQGDLSGLHAIGLDNGDFRDLAQDQRLSSQTITIMAASLDIEKGHAEDILEDFRSEFKAQVRAGRIKL